MSSSNTTAALRGLVLTVAMAASVLALSPSPSAASDPSIRLGASVRYAGGQSVQQSLERVEAELGQGHLGAVRLYHAWDEWFPQGGEQFLKNASRSATLPVLSINTVRRNGDRVWWNQMADAQYGSQIHSEMIRWAEDLKAFGRPIVVALNHEPDFYRNGGTGSPWYYKKAYEKFVWILRNRGATNVRTAFIGVAWNFDSRSSTQANDYYPGDGWVDVLGVDGYNWWTCREASGSWRSVDDVFGAFLSWSELHPGKPLLIAEFGAAEDPGNAGRKRQWMQDATAAFGTPRWDRLEIVTWWDQVHESFGECDFRIGSSTTSKAGFAEMLASPVFG